jgi:toxin ParE1/3/4
LPRRRIADRPGRARVAGAPRVRYRLSEPAGADIAAILRRSEERHGKAARLRYRACLAAALRRIAADPEGPPTADRSALVSGLRSFHIHHSRNESRTTPVANPTHVIFYRATEPAVIEIVRVLHERMEPRRHVAATREGEA